MQKIVSVPFINFNIPAHLRVCRTLLVPSDTKILRVRYDNIAHIIYLDVLINLMYLNINVLHVHVYPNDLLLAEDEKPQEILGAVDLESEDADAFAKSLDYYAVVNDATLKSLYICVMDNGGITPQDLQDMEDDDTKPDDSKGDLNIGGLNDIEWN